MNPEHWQRIKEMFQHAIELSPAERRAYLDTIRERHPDLHDSVAGMLEEDETADEFLSPPDYDVSCKAIGKESGSEAGVTIGSYRLERKLATGGMGTVYLARRMTDYDELVAVKLIKRGMDTELILRRFAQERQTLASLAHPSIGRLLDGGATDDGRPYLVMEYIDGKPIDEYCDTKNLPVEERLRLFVDVCAAVQFAHSKHIIHRDLKPSNILVIEQAGRPFAKIIDFGIATLIASTPDGKTTLTLQGEVLGSPRYMSPEQADADGAAVDERADVYSLGVILYLLLAGSLPYAKAPDTVEELRRLHESDAPTPSTRLRGRSDDSTVVAQRRSTDPVSLRKVLRGDLDWITRRAIETERERRYSSVSALAADVERYLHDEPVLAGPPGARYRLAGFVRRNKLFVGVLSALFISILAGLVASTSWYVRADALRRDRDAILRMTDSVGSEVSDAHLWFEEWLAADSTVQIDSDVLDRLERMRASVAALLDGEPVNGVAIGSVVRNENRAAAETLADLLADFDDLTRERRRRGADGGQTGGELDQQYDAIYLAIQDACHRIRRAVDQADFKDWRRSASMSIRIHALVLVIFAALVLIFLRKRTA